MFCRSCGTSLGEGAVACTNCGRSPMSGTGYCPSCGAATNAQAVACTNCGAGLHGASVGGSAQSNNRVVAGVLAIFFGQFGIHKFILGYTTEGVIMLVLGAGLAWFTCFVSCFVMWIIAVIEGIIYLTKSDEEFYQTYVVNKRGWF